MRKFLVTSALTLLVAVLFVLPVYANDIRVTVNGEVIVFTGQAPVNVDGRTLVPVRGVFEALGFDVDFDGDTQRVTLSSDDYTVNLYVGNANFTANDTSHTLDVPAQIIGGSTMLPIRAVLESVGYYLDWDGSTSTVIVSSTPIAAQEQQAQASELPYGVVDRGLVVMDGHFIGGGFSRELHGDEDVLSLNPRIIDGHVMMSSYILPDLARIPDWQIRWDDDRILSFQAFNGIHIILIIDQATMMVNGAPVMLEVPPRKDDIFLYPICCIARALGMNAEWNDDGQPTLFITSDSQ